MANTLSKSDWVHVGHGGFGLRRIYDTFKRLSSDNRPIGGANIFESDVIQGTGAPQSTPHGLGETPNIVFAVPTEFTNVGSIVEGTHTSTNCVFTVAAAWKYKIIAILY